MTDENAQNEFDEFLAWKAAREAQPVAERRDNGAFCNGFCDFDSRQEAADRLNKSTEGDREKTGEPPVKPSYEHVLGEGVSAVETLVTDLLAALDHNALTGHHLTVKSGGHGFQINPRQMS